MLLEKTKSMAVLGIMAALSTVLTVLGTFISVNTVFFTAAAAFLAGIAVVEYGLGRGMLFFVVCSLLDFFINPNKLHILLYIVFALYFLVAEGSYTGLKKWSGKKKERLHAGIRLSVFAVLYVPAVIFIPGLFVADTVLERWMDAPWFLPALLIAGVPFWLIFDLSYFAVKKEVNKIFRTVKSGNQ